jgi:c-di-GMP-binding flagellar brake protein YcgR
MQSLLSLIGLFSVVFAVSYGISSLVIFIKRKKPEGGLQPLENAKVRLKTSSAMYRSRLLEHGPDGWVFAAPMQRDSYIPIPIGEEMTCEVMARGGVLLFQSKVIARRSGQGALVVEAPVKPQLTNRRDQSRRVDIPMEVLVGGQSAAVINLSEGGAKVKIKGFEREGNVIRVALSSGEARAATVLESENGREGSVIRLSFDQPITIPKD